MATKYTTFTAKVSHVDRQGYTIYGNPIKSVGFDDLTYYRISDNAALAYEIENAEFRTEPHTFYVTPAGRIAFARKG